MKDDDDKILMLEMFQGNPRRETPPTRPAKEPARDADEGRCAAFGYLRGVEARALGLELRYRTDDSEWFSYGLLSSWRYNPSVGLLLRFEGGTIYLVLIRGSNLDALVGEDGVNLTHRGVQWHRITYIREMEKEELRRTGERGPTIDRIEVAEFDSQDDLSEWFRNNAPAFLRE